MANKQNPREDGRQRTHEETGNGIAHEVSSMKQSLLKNPRSEFAGYVILAGGIVLLLFSYGLLPMLRWFFVATSIALIGWGIFQSNVITKIGGYIENWRRSRR